MVLEYHHVIHVPFGPIVRRFGSSMYRFGPVFVLFRGSDGIQNQTFSSDMISATIKSETGVMILSRYAILVHLASRLRSLKRTRETSGELNTQTCCMLGLYHAATRIHCTHVCSTVYMCHQRHILKMGTLWLGKIQ